MLEELSNVLTKLIPPWNLNTANILLVLDLALTLAGLALVVAVIVKVAKGKAHFKQALSEENTTETLAKGEDVTLSEQKEPTSVSISVSAPPKELKAQQSTSEAVERSEVKANEAEKQSRVAEPISAVIPQAVVPRTDDTGKPILPKGEVTPTPPTITSPKGVNEVRDGSTSQSINAVDLKKDLVELKQSLSRLKELEAKTKSRPLQAK